jgi:hypothetical protein
MRFHLKRHHIIANMHDNIKQGQLNSWATERSYLIDYQLTLHLRQKYHT